MSDNEDWLDDDLGGESLTDFNPGNEEEDLLLADDYESASQNVPSSGGYGDRQVVPAEYPRHSIVDAEPRVYQAPVEPECVVPNITVEIPNTPVDRSHCTYAPYEPSFDPERTVPRAVAAAPPESPQIVPSDLNPPITNEVRPRFISERNPQRMPQVRDIPDSLDKVVIPRSSFRGRPWMRPPFARHHHPYRTNYMHRAKFNQRVSFPPPQVRPDIPQIRLENRPPAQLDIRPTVQPNIRPTVQPEIRPTIRPDIRPAIQPEPRLGQPGPIQQEVRPIRQEVRPIQPDIRPIQPEIRPVQQEIRPDIRPVQPDMRPIQDIRPDIPMVRPQIEPMNEMPPDIRIIRPEVPMRPDISPERPPDFRNPPRFFRPPMEGQFIPMRPNFEPRGVNQHFRGYRPMVSMQQEVRMLPVLPPLSGKKVLINPHFKGNFQPPIEGPLNDIDDAAERFIAEQRNALARAANRKRRSPQRYIENTTIEIENDLAQSAPWVRASAPPSEDQELLRRQEEFINANRAGLRRRMRSPSPPRRPPSPRRSPPRRPRENDEESEYKRRVREQETLRERVLRAKEQRRRRNAQLSRQHDNKEEKEKTPPKPEPKPEKPLETKPVEKIAKPVEIIKPDTTKKSPERKPDVKRGTPPLVKEGTPIRDDTEVNSTCETLTPPPPACGGTPPLPRAPSDDELDLILEDIDGILSDDEDTGRFKDKSTTSEPQSTKNTVDLRSKIAPKTTLDKKQERQKIVFNEDKEKDKKNDKSPPNKPVVTSTKSDPAEVVPNKIIKVVQNVDIATKNRQRIVFDNKEQEKDEEKRTFANRRVILQRKEKPRIEINKESLGMLNRALRREIPADPPLNPPNDPPNDPPSHGATVTNLPFGITDTRIRTLAGPLLQTLILDKEERTAKVTFKTKEAAETFKRKFNNKMVAASRLTVTLD